jgi:hypothetical protein
MQADSAVSIEISPNEAEQKGAYRFLANKKTGESCKRHLTKAKSITFIEEGWINLNPCMKNGNYIHKMCPKGSYFVERGDFA